MTLSAWKALHAYLSDSAASIDVACSGRSSAAKSSEIAASVRSSRTPTTVNGGSKKSSTPPLTQELRRHGHAEVDVDTAPALPLEQRPQRAVDGAGRHGAPVDDRDEASLSPTSRAISL